MGIPLPFKGRGLPIRPGWSCPLWPKEPLVDTLLHTGPLYPWSPAQCLVCGRWSLGVNFPSEVLHSLSTDSSRARTWKSISQRKPKILPVVKLELQGRRGQGPNADPSLDPQRRPSCEVHPGPCFLRNPNSFIPEGPANFSAWCVWMTCPTLSVWKLCRLALNHLNFQPSRSFPLISKAHDIIHLRGPVENQSLGMSRPSHR